MAEKIHELDDSFFSDDEEIKEEKMKLQMLKKQYKEKVKKELKRKNDILEKKLKKKGVSPYAKWLTKSRRKSGESFTRIKSKEENEDTLASPESETSTLSGHTTVQSVTSGASMLSLSSVSDTPLNRNIEMDSSQERPLGALDDSLSNVNIEQQQRKEELKPNEPLSKRTVRGFTRLEDKIRQVVGSVKNRDQKRLIKSKNLWDSPAKSANVAIPGNSSTANSGYNFYCPETSEEVKEEEDNDSGGVTTIQDIKTIPESADPSPCTVSPVIDSAPCVPNFSVSNSAPKSSQLSVELFTPLTPSNPSLKSEVDIFSTPFESVGAEIDDSSLERFDFAHGMSALLKKNEDTFSTPSGGLSLSTLPSIHLTDSVRSNVASSTVSSMSHSEGSTRLFSSAEAKNPSPALQTTTTSFISHSDGSTKLFSSAENFAETRTPSPVSLQTTMELSQFSSFHVEDSVRPSRVHFPTASKLFSIADSFSSEEIDAKNESLVELARPKTLYPSSLQSAPAQRHALLTLSATTGSDGSPSLFSSTENHSETGALVSPAQEDHPKTRTPTSSVQGNHSETGALMSPALHKTLPDTPPVSPMSLSFDTPSEVNYRSKANGKARGAKAKHQMKRSSKPSVSFAKDNTYVIDDPTDETVKDFNPRKSERRRKGGLTPAYLNYVRGGVWPPVVCATDVRHIPKNEQLEQMTNAVVNKPAQKDVHYVEVPSRLEPHTQAENTNVHLGEIVRRLSAPESMTSLALCRYLRKAPTTQNFVDDIRRVEVGGKVPLPREGRYSAFSMLTEADVQRLTSDLVTLMEEVPIPPLGDTTNTVQVVERVVGSFTRDARFQALTHGGATIVHGVCRVVLDRVVRHLEAKKQNQ